MSTLIFIRAKHFIKKNTIDTKPASKSSDNIFVVAVLAIAGLIATSSVAHAEWTVDFSRRFKEVQNQDLRSPASLDAPTPSVGSSPSSFNTSNTTKSKNTPESSGSSSQGVFSSLWSVTEPSQEIVILNTAKGFVPSTVRLKQGFTYRFHIVNINPKEKNVSFVMDTLSEQHGTYFAEPSTFDLKAEKDGVHKFACPETSIEGRLIITPNAEVRAPAAEGL